MRERFKEFTHTLTKALDTWKDLASPETMEECVPITLHADLVGMAYYKPIPNTVDIEMGVVVHRDYQGLGLGTWGVKALMERARMNGHKKIYAKVFKRNEPMLKLMEKLDWGVQLETEDSIYFVKDLNE